MVLIKGGKGAEILDHIDLKDMDATVHDARYYTETEVDTLFGSYVPYTGATARVDIGSQDFRSTGSGRFDRLGIGTSIGLGSAYRICVIDTITTTAQYGVYVQPIVETTAGNISYVVGSEALVVSSDGSNNVSSIYGTVGGVLTQTDFSGTIADAYGLFAEGYFYAGTTTNFYGTFIQNPSGSGHLTNYYGLYIENPTAGSTLNYAIYSAGGDNYFAGNLTDGTNSLTVANAKTAYDYSQIGHVPYTGATADVDLGAYNFITTGYIKPTGGIYSSSGLIFDISNSLIYDTSGGKSLDLENRQLLDGSENVIFDWFEDNEANFLANTIKTTGDLTDGTNTLTIANAKIAYDHVTATGASHSYIDQSVTTTADPVFYTMTARTTYENQPFFYKGKRISIVNPYATKANEYQGQIHCHSDESDGADTPTELETAYKDAGYDFVSITDHDTVTADPSVADILHITGVEESTDDGHIGAIGITTQSASTDPQTVIDAIIADGGIPFVNHPNKSGNPYTTAELELINAYFGMEAYNDRADVGNAEDVWDVLLSRHYRAYGTAVDDCHDIGGADFDNAWIQVFADSLTEANIKESLKRGNFYSSTGPTLAISVSKKVITATTDSASTILFIKDGGATAQTTASVTTKDYTIIGDEKYIRIKVTRDSDSKIAWSNPITIYLEGTSEFAEGGLVDGNLYVTGNVTATGTVEGDTITDGTLSINSGAITGGTTAGFSGKVTATGFLDNNLIASKPVFTDASKNLISTGTMPINQGGTGQTTALAAFEALSPIGTEGDILIRGASNDIALAIGANTQVLTVDTGEPGKLKWAAGGAGGVTEFTALDDTPDSYVDQAGKYCKVNANEDELEFDTPAGAGDVVGPGSSTDNAIVLFDGVTGKLLQEQVNTNEAGIIGRTKIGAVSSYSDYAWFGHMDMAHNQYALLQSPSGITFINCAGGGAGSGNCIKFRIANADYMEMDRLGNFKVGGTVPDAKFEVQNTAGQHAMTIDQNSSTNAFIDFQGYEDEGGSYTISTRQGDGCLDGPKKTSCVTGWKFNSMLRMEQNGGEVWLCTWVKDECPC